MIQIRAGVLKRLKGQFSSIYRDTIKETICKNGLRELVEAYAIVDLMEEKGLFNECIDIGTVEPNIILGEHTDLIVSFLLQRYSMENIYIAFALFFEVAIMYSSELVKLNCWKDVHESIGYQKEAFVRKELEKIGIVVGSVRNKTKKFYYAGTTIKLNGRPDGIIVESYGDIYKKGTVVEIKYKKTLTARVVYNKNDDIMQLVAYAVLFGADVLYVCVNDNDEIFIDTYKYEYLLGQWNLCADDIFKNCAILNNLFSAARYNESKLKELLYLIKSG